MASKFCAYCFRPVQNPVERRSRFYCCSHHADCDGKRNPDIEEFRTAGPPDAKQLSFG